MPRPVVLTRPQAQAGPLAARLRALGREVVLLPLLEIDALDDAAPLQAAMDQLAQFALVAFVSPNAIDAAFACIDKWPAGVTLAVLGEGSRVALGAHGVTPANAHIVSPPDAAHSDSEHLLQSLDLAALRGRRALIVRGDGGRELMADGLRAAGVEVQQVCAYRRSVPRLTDALATRLRALLMVQNDWVVTSSEALRGLLGLLEQLDAAQPPQAAADSAVVKMQHQHLFVPHARIAQTANTLGLCQLTLTGSGDERLLAALQSRP